nr:hypothetical protein [Candidatus Krumholzibacteria bacterium]
MPRQSHAFLLLLLSALWLVTGCSSDEAREMALVSGQPREGSLVLDSSAQESPSMAGFSAEITLCRKVSKRSGRPIGEDVVFHPAARSYVNALVDFRGVKEDRTYVIHLVWVRPDGKDVFRKYVEVVPTISENGERQTLVTWLDAEKLHKVKRDTVAAEGAEFQLQTRLNISNKRARDPGQYALRVYLDRRFLGEKTFEVTAGDSSAQGD